MWEIKLLIDRERESEREVGCEIHENDVNQQSKSSLHNGRKHLQTP